MGKPTGTKPHHAKEAYDMTVIFTSAPFKEVLLQNIKWILIRYRSKQSVKDPELTR